MKIIHLVINNGIRSEVYFTVSAQCPRNGFLKLVAGLEQPVADSTENIRFFIKEECTAAKY